MMHAPWVTPRTAAAVWSDSVVLGLSLSTVVSSLMFLIWFVVRRWKQAAGDEAGTPPQQDLGPTDIEKEDRKQDAYPAWKGLGPQDCEGHSPQDILWGEQPEGVCGAEDSLVPGPVCDMSQGCGDTGPIMAGESLMKLDLVRHCTAASGWQQDLTAEDLHWDQNRNKTSKSAVGSLKRSNQPDVVTNSVAPPDAAEEIGRLEALCEARTKQLNVARIQLRTGAMGFEAMTALVNYLTHELDAFSCPEVTAQLKAVREQLSDSQAQLGELAENKASLEKELADLREKNIADLQQLRDSHQRDLQSLEERLGTEKQQEVERVVEKYAHEVSALKSFLEKNISEMKTQHDKSLKEREQQHSDDLKRVEQDHEQQIADLQKQHERRMEEITMTFEHIKFTLSDKVETLRGECDEMRVREHTLQERSQREAEHKVHMALVQYKHLPAEIDSLKAVMEMRNQELHELRRKKLDLEKQLEEIPQAREKIIALQQKLENLEAIIDIKADYERQLAEKHHVLLRKFDRESKANKRLSMDNEELAWRLSNADSPDMLRRSVSHSPTHSAEVTPEVVRRRKSPSCTVPSSPRATEFDKSPVMHSPPKTNLRRSGTYDLLNKDLDEREMRQSDV